MTPLGRIRLWLCVFMLGLVLAGLTAFPLESELRLLRSAVANAPWPDLRSWIARVDEGVRETNARYPFMAYGTDWLAFAHLVIAIAFIGPLRDPLRNVWVIDVGIIACILVPVLAFVCGPLRGIPPFWRAIDSAFGVLGLIPLLTVRRLIGTLAA